MSGILEKEEVSQGKAFVEAPGVPEQRRGNFSPGALVRWTLIGLFGTGTAGGVGYTLYEQEQLRQQNSQLMADQEGMRGIIQNQQLRLGEQVSLNDLKEAVDMVKGATVRVEGKQWLGSGVIITDNLGRMYILTNGHVTEDNGLEKGDGTGGFNDQVYKITLYTGNDFKEGVQFHAAPVVGQDGKRAHSLSDKRDLALLQIPPEIEQQILKGKISVPRLAIANRVTHPLQAGERVLAVGNPFGERDHVTDGIVSNSDAFGDIEPENAFIRMSAPINGGNSGGGLWRVRREHGKLVCELVGINTWGYRGGDGVAGSIDVRVIALQCKDWGVPIVSEEEIAAYERWWQEVIVPFQKKHGIGGNTPVPPTHD